MAKIRYKCDDNGHEFEGNDFSNECPTCGSTISPLGSGSGIEFIAKFKETVSNNKLVVGVLALILLFIIIYNIIESPSDRIYSINLLPKDNYLEIEITSKDIESNKSIKIEPSKILSIINDKVEVAGSDKVFKIKHENRIYLCAEDTIEEHLYIFKSKPNVMLKKDKISSSFKFRGAFVSPDADCGPQPFKPSEIIVNTEGKNCKLIVSISRDIQGQTLYISVDGQYGHYVSNKFIWDRKPLINTKQNVWVYIEGSDESYAINSSTNGVTIHEAGCVQKDNSEIIKQFIVLANEFGKDPQNRTAQVAFQSFVENNIPQTVIYLNGELLDDLASLQNRMKVMASNDSKTFEIIGTPILSSDNSTITFRFQEIR